VDRDRAMKVIKTSGIVRMTASSAVCTPRSDLHVSRFARVLGNTYPRPLERVPIEGRPRLRLLSAPLAAGPWGYAPDPV
jgi:hypothetical protein